MPSSIHNKQGGKKLLILNVSLGPEMLREERKEGKKDMKDSSRNLKDCLPNLPLEKKKRNGKKGKKKLTVREMV
jgi:hypothetical protein